MFEIISKSTYWASLDNALVATCLERTSRQMICLKHVQDAWILSRLAGQTGKRILEVGGGYARVLRTLDDNERWLLDKPNGSGRTVVEQTRKAPKDFTLINGYLGDFSPELPSNYFDTVFSISVIEHVPLEKMSSFMKDHARVLKPGGIGFHAIDLYVGDVMAEWLEQRLNAYLESIAEGGLTLLAKPNIDRPCTFKCRFASNPDLTMRHWNVIAPQLSKQRALKQSVSLAVGVTKQA